MLDERLRAVAVNAGASRPEASIAFGTFVEEQWKALVLPTFNASTQHGYKTILNAHVLPVWRDWRLRDNERLAIQQTPRRARRPFASCSSPLLNNVCECGLLGAPEAFWAGLGDIADLSLVLCRTPPLHSAVDILEFIRIHE